LYRKRPVGQEVQVVLAETQFAQADEEHRAQAKEPGAA